MKITKGQLTEIIKEVLKENSFLQSQGPEPSNEELIQQLTSRVQSLEWDVGDLKKEIENIKWRLPED